MFYRVGNTDAISLDDQSVISRIKVFDRNWVTLYLRDGESIDMNLGHPHYAAYVQFVADCPVLVDELQMQSLAELRRQHTHPLMDEMPPTLFALFQSLPHGEGMELHLLQSGAGELWKDGMCVLSWEDFSEGLTLLAKQHARLHSSS